MDEGRNLSWWNDGYVFAFVMIYLLLTPVSSFFRLRTLCEPCFSSQNARYPFCVKKLDGFARLMCIQYELSVYYPSKHELNPLLF